MIERSNQYQAEQLVSAGCQSGKNHQIEPGQIPDQLGVYQHLSSLDGWLDETRHYCQSPDPDHVRIADWLLDNDYRVKRAIRQLRFDLPREFYQQLPVLKSSDSQRLPRLFYIAHQILRALPRQITRANLVIFINAYQQESELKLAELWALPSFLRLTCLENLVDAFQEVNQILAPIFTVSAEALANRHVEAADRVSEAISGLAAIKSIEWQDFVDQTSLVERVLTEDPLKVYDLMSFETRNKYRTIIERLSLGSVQTETVVARLAIDLAEERLTSDPSEQQDDREAHVGYWLVDAGRSRLEAVLEYQPPFMENLRKLILGHAGIGYATALLTVFLLALLLPEMYLRNSGASVWIWLGGMGLSLLPASVFSVTLVQWLITLLVRPRQLPSMDYRKGIPSECRTAVAVPVIVAQAEDVDGLLERLEIRWLSNPDPSLCFVLLSDLMDAPTEHTPQDIHIEQALESGINRLNRQYSPAGEPFVLMHRRRHHSLTECCWMGRERKRGKLEQFNAFILNGSLGEFSVSVGDVEQLRLCKFVITLDADTMLPPQTAAKLIGTIMHPLNRPIVSQQTGKVTSGYTVIQPRVEVLPLSGPVSLFCRLFAGDTAIDIYSRAVSDLYQDLFGTGIFVGKGIYDVRAFQASLENRVPDAAILSHDLFEGVQGRTALASNIVLYENYPSSYPEYAMRLHRWIRGDWQLIPWLGSTVPAADDSRINNDLSLLDRWKIIDNLRRSLVSPALLLFFLCGWMILPGSAWLWTLLAVATPGVYLLTEVIGIFSQALRLRYLSGIGRRVSERSGRWLLTVTFLVSDTVLSIDAVMRTIWRLFVSRRYLLQWRSTALVASVTSQAGPRLVAWKLMWPSTFLALLLGAVLWFFYHDSMLPAAPVLLLWLLAPEIAIFMGRSRSQRREQLDDHDRRLLKHLSRRTWHFFETFAGPEDNWLPPDNFQEDPRGAVAHRTSPTNIGLLMTSSLMAHDAGFIGSNDFVIRMRNALDTLQRMKSYRGHLLNWYNTQTLQPLEPQYVSTVDSGNLAVCLIALKQGCQTLLADAVFNSAIWDGLSCTFELLSAGTRRLDGADEKSLDGLEDHFQKICEKGKFTDADWLELADQLYLEFWPEYETLVAAAVESSATTSQKNLVEVHVWLERFQHDLISFQRELRHFCPWLSCIKTSPVSCQVMAKNLASTISPLTSISQTDTQIDHALQLVDDKLAVQQTDLDARAWLVQLREALTQGQARQHEFQADIQQIIDVSHRLAFAMDFKLLYDPELRLFRIGYNFSMGQSDRNHYDLLATEARLASLFAIAKGDAPIEHWFFLGRPITRLKGRPAILSWSGSMFEYLMPPLFVPGHRDTLLGESESIAVEFQRLYGHRHRIPWGISESAYGATDGDDNYQYQAFGVPGLGFRRVLTEDLVVAPYATALALSRWPKAAVKNLRKLDQMYSAGIYGFVDALDFTAGRLPHDANFKVVKTYMAHHQGMLLAAIANALNDDIFVARVMSEKSMAALDILLQERIPWDVVSEEGRAEKKRALPVEHRRPAVELISWVPSNAATIPQMHMMGNGRMNTWLSESGAGGLFWQGMALTRWLPDATRDAHGYWLYIKDKSSGEVWSAGRLPTGESGHESKTVFHQHLVEDFRRHQGLAVRTETTVAPDDDVDIRRVTVINEGDAARTLEFTSYAEVVLAPPLDDERHPAFSKLFVASSFDPLQEGLLFNRQANRTGLATPVLLHKALYQRGQIEFVGYETDRSKFVGRNDDFRCPQGVHGKLTQTTGWTLDPVMVLRLRVSLKPHETKSFTLLVIAGENETAVKKVAVRYSPVSLDWIYRDAARVTAREITHLRIAPEFLPVMQALSAVLVQPHPALRRIPAGVGYNLLGQANLWRFGLSGDIPILLLRLTHERSMSLLEELIRAQCYWRRTGLKFDIAVLRTDIAGYEDPLREKIQDILRDTSFADSLGRSGGIHLLAGAEMSPEVRRGLEAAAHVVIDGDISLREKLDCILEQRSVLPLMLPTRDAWQEPPTQATKPPALLFENGLGGFDAANGDYVIHLEAGQQTPAPWCNVLASEEFGSIVSDSHLGFTWAVNSGENRLTPLSNDPRADTPGEVLYLRDESTAEFWTPTPAPLGNDAACTVTHSKGFTRWQRQCHGLEQILDVWVSVDDPIKLLRLRLKNQLPQQRRLTATFYAEWLFGALGSRVRPHVVCEYDASLHAILAGNPWNADFAERIGFVSASKAPQSVTGDRFEFLGSEGDVRRPAGLQHMSLGGHFAPGVDACAGYQVHIDLAPGEDAEVVFMLGQGAQRAEMRHLVKRYQDPVQVEHSFVAVQQFWAARLQRVQVSSPDPAFDMMINHWLLYQSLASRVLARAGFYQASGAFGFRDQLQDGLALLAVDPVRVRSLILAAAAHQFDTGDVQHWWHPPSDRGVKTRCSDDYLWLVFVTARYVESTGDNAVLDVEIPYLLAPELRDDEHDRYARFDNGRPANLFEHCLKALDRMLATGSHGLPLMGTGDWNDGMDRVGAKGQGESVWLAWFQIAVVNAFMPLAKARGYSFTRWQDHASRLKLAIDACAWDGSWFIRAFDDDGEPWGSQQNEACQIDSISQSWGVLAGFADDARVQQAMASAHQHLLVEGAGLVPLLTPPFHASTRDPGYIQAYPPGVRENGGQYNHAVAWLGLASCGLGDGDTAWQLFDRMNPINRTNSPEGAAHYGREPYVLAGDIATEGQQRGQGGWSWYTGSASWAWQLGIEGLLGLRLRADGLQIRPCLPKDWETVSVRFERDQSGILLLTINNPDRVGQGAVDLLCDGQALSGDLVKFPGLGQTSRIEVNIRAASTDKLTSTNA